MTGRLSGMKEGYFKLYIVFVADVKRITPKPIHVTKVLICCQNTCLANIKGDKFKHIGWLGDMKRDNSKFYLVNLADMKENNFKHTGVMSG